MGNAQFILDDLAAVSLFLTFGFIVNFCSKLLTSLYFLYLIYRSKTSISNFIINLEYPSKTFLIDFYLDSWD